ncbi:sodium:solute symporter family protein [Pontibacillus yanchengensis]|uniref:Sodium:solute symporter family protein n=2 Tax=Pontibacillus yanchengensis TaxID=462910 RepID=A0ACC7VGA6_9BACI|nr:sodium:solute symporter family protein [Pontibacillus yanchengensis]MYL34349.1 sodium:solute symporter family protein [Pontibacillus yanchengensis]MYL53817.1 sodium:solute symporter family protein [Pontibacillus yanchengensis]
MGTYAIYFFIYFGFLFGMGIYYFFKVKSADDYLIAGWNMGFWSIVGTIISTFCGAAVFIGWVGMGFSVGMSGFFKFALPAYVFSLVLVLLFAKPLRRQRLYTLADLFSERFGSKLGIFPSVLSAFIYSVPTLALQIVGMSTVFKWAFGIDAVWGIFISFALILAFTILGGLPATIITDAVQAVILVIGIVLLFGASVNFGGGFEQILSNTPSEYLTPLGNAGLSGVLLFALSVGPFYIIWQSTWQRIFASKSEKIAKSAGVTALLIAMVVSIFPYAIGVIARQYVPQGMNQDEIFSYVTVDMLPPAIGGIILIGLLSALMTGADSFILQGSSNLTQDLYNRLMKPDASKKELMVASRVSVVIISVLGLILSYMITDIITIYQWALRLSAVTLVLPFLAVMFWRKVTKRAVFISMLSSAIITTIWPLLGIGWNQTIVGFLISLVTLVGISLMTEHSETEKVKAVYFEDFDRSKTTYQESTTYHA